MQVQDFMNRQIMTASPDTPLLEVWKLIFQKHIHGIPIVDRNKKILGLISEEDLLTKLYPDYKDVIPDFSAENTEDEEIKMKMDKLKKWDAAKVMNRRVYYTRPHTHVMRALSRMIIRKVRQLPVLDDDDRLVGMISKGDIFDGLFKRNVKKLVSKQSNK